jgi:hypothetical protein
MIQKTEKNSRTLGIPENRSPTKLTLAQLAHHILPRVDSNLNGVNFGLDTCGCTQPSQDNILEEMGRNNFELPMNQHIYLIICLLQMLSNLAT